MSKGMLAVGIIVLGILTFGVVSIVQNFQSGSELDYYLLKETTEAAMIDAVDINYYRTNGQIRIDKEKFAENFVRRFAQSVDKNRYYDIKMYDINETPPKVSIQVDSATSLTFDDDHLDISTKIDGILESTYKNDALKRELMEDGKLTGKGNLDE